MAANASAHLCDIADHDWTYWTHYGKLTIAGPERGTAERGEWRWCRRCGEEQYRNVTWEPRFSGRPDR